MKGISKKIIAILCAISIVFSTHGVMTFSSNVDNFDYVGTNEDETVEETETKEETEEETEAEEETEEETETEAEEETEAETEEEAEAEEKGM